MNIEKLKRLIISQKEQYSEFFKENRVIDRDVNIGKLKLFISHPNVLVITGVRRSGKSILSQLLDKKNKFGYFNFSDERAADFKSADLETLVRAFYELYGTDVNNFIFDEVQEVPGWEKFVSRLRLNNRIIITGSNSRLLSTELSTFLTGRHLDFTLFPFDFKEYLSFENTELADNWQYSDKTVSIVKSMLERYLKNGGFPESLTLGKDIVSVIYGDILEKDVVRRYSIRKATALREIANYLISNTANEITFSKIKASFFVKDLHTVINYANYLSSAFLVYLIKRFSFKLKKQFMAPKKVYCIDNGIVSRINLNMDERKGRLMENLVCISLFRRKSYDFEDFDVFYWKDALQREVDFLIKRGKNVEQLIQVTNASSNEEINERETKNLLIASKELRCDDLLVITWDYEAEEKIKGKKIKFVPLWKWLLNV